MAEQGNIAAMREALKAVTEKLFDVAPTAEQEWPELVQRARAALAIPARNCDVGTAEEQHDRWREFCNGNWNCANAAAGLDPCDDCQFVDCDVNGGSFGCQFAWGQMPYEGEEESNG